MTTSTSRSASADPTASSCPGRKRSNPNSSCSAPCGSVARATGSGGGGPRPGRARVEAVSMGRRTLPPAPAGAGRLRALRASLPTKAPQAAAKLLQTAVDGWWESARMEVVDDYLAELTRRLRAVLGEELVAVYAAGSYSMGAYEHGRSDIDVAVVVEDSLGGDAKRAIVDALRH